MEQVEPEVERLPDIGFLSTTTCSWLRGSGAVATFNLMEDAATSKIARRPCVAVAPAQGCSEGLPSAEFVEFLTLPAYDLVE